MATLGWTVGNHHAWGESFNLFLGTFLLGTHRLQLRGDISFNLDLNVMEEMFRMLVHTTPVC